MEEIIKRKDLKYETNKYRIHFQQFKTIRSFGDCIHNGKINLKEVEKKQKNLFENIVNFDNKSRPRKDNEENQIPLII